MIHFVLTATKRRIMEDFLTYEGAPLVGRMELVAWEELAGAEHLEPGTWVLADLDALGPAGLELARAVRAAATDAGFGVLNDPDRTLCRLDLLRALHREGVNDYRAFRATDVRDAGLDADAGPGGAGAGPARSDAEGSGIAAAELRYPVFVRGASDHFGPLGDLLHGPDELASTLARAAEGGVDVDDLIVVEFEETARADGRRTKFGAYVVGERVHLQHFMLGRPWMIKHSQSDFTIPIAEEELAYVTENPHREALEEVAAIAGVEYGRIDYAVDPDGRIQVWEINLCPIVGRARASPKGFAPAFVQPYRQRTKDVFNPRLVAAWEAVDADPDGGPAGAAGGPGRISLDLPEELRERVRRELAPKGGAEGLVTLLRAKRLFGKRW